MIKFALLICAAMGLSGCYSIQGSERVLNNQGKLTREVSTGSIFRSDFEYSYNKRMMKTVTQSDIDTMLSSGFSHIYSFCDGYFDSMGLQQRKSRVTRDAIAPIAALMTGILALHNFDKNTGRKEDIVGAIGLTTAATASILDIYDEHMLFGAENIGAVEQLTKAALFEHAGKVLTTTGVSFDTAIRHLLDNQALCSPQFILSLTREAIREGKVTARTNTPPATAGPAALAAAATSEPYRRVDVSIDNQ